MIRIPNFESSQNIKDAELKNLGNLKEPARLNPHVFLLPMSDWHLHNYKRAKADTGPLQMLWLIGIIGAFVLLLACINFMNLSTARSENREKEIGIRKAVGSVRRQLIGQFYCESFLIVVLAFVVSMILVAISLPAFNDLSAKLDKNAIPESLFLAIKHRIYFYYEYGGRELSSLVFIFFQPG